MKRRDNARTCQMGASNERRVASCLVEAIDECRAEGVDPAADNSVYLIAHQLNHLIFFQDSAERYTEAYNDLFGEN